jgi:hypothetical protein
MGAKDDGKLETGLELMPGSIKITTNLSYRDEYSV